jgi:hypothetical protein
VRAARVHIRLARSGNHHEIHVVHRDRAEHHAFAHHHRAGKAGSVLEADFDRTDVGHEPAGTIRQDDFSFANPLQAQVIANLLWNAEVQETGVGKGIDLDRQGRDARIAQENRAHE